MSTLLRHASAVVLFFLAPSAQLAPAQDKPSTASPAPSNFRTEYASDDVGVLVENSGWVDLSQELPSKTRTKRGLVSALSYGVVPGAIIAEYPGQHAELQIENRRPRLHPKKDSRELDAGRLPAVGAKIAEAKQSDLVPAEV